MEFLARFVNILAMVLYIALIARVVVSWLNLSADNPLVAILYQVTEPILAPIRRVLPAFGMLDFSPIVALILIGIIQWIVGTLAS